MRTLLFMLASGVMMSGQSGAPIVADPVCRPSLVSSAVGGPQVVDAAFVPHVSQPAFALGQGYRVLLDEGHQNVHTLDGSYAPFAKVLRDDGFVVEANRQSLSAAVLSTAKILVISNAGGRRGPNQDGTFIPSTSVFLADEVEAVRQWVFRGGSLFLIVDHLPNSGGSAALARAFGILLNDGYAVDATCSTGQFLFARSDGSLAEHPITRGRRKSERVDHVRTFTGTAFRALVPVSPILVLAPGAVMLMPSVPWQFTSATPRFPGDAMLQGAVLRHGRGRVAVFGEAAMFSAQVTGAQRRPMGMNADTADQNEQFLINVTHWLAGLLPDR